MSLAKLTQPNLLRHHPAEMGRGNSRSSKQPTGTLTFPGYISGYQKIRPPQVGQNTGGRALHLTPPWQLVSKIELTIDI